MQREELAAWLRLTTARGLGLRAVRRLLARFGLPQEVLAHAMYDWVDCISAAQAQALQAHSGDALQPLVERTWQWLQTQAAA